MKTDNNIPAQCDCCTAPADPDRRRALGGVLAAAVSPLLVHPAFASAGSERSPRPAVGDRLAFMLGERKDQAIGPGDIEPGTAPVLAYPKDPGTGEVLASRANILVVVRLDPSSLSEEVAAKAVDGVVAYSALCTHNGCPVTVRDPTQTKLVCNCHGSVFDPAHRGVVLDGPAYRRLPMLPLQLERGELVVAAPFDGPIGPPT